MLEAAPISHELMQHFSRMTKWRMPEIVCQRMCLGQIGVYTQDSRQSTGNLGDFQVWVRRVR